MICENKPTGKKETGESPLAIKRKNRRRTSSVPFWKQLYFPFLIAAIVLTGALFLHSCLFAGGSRTLPEQVQAKMPAWVDQQLLTPNEYSRPQIEVKEVNAIVIHYVGNPGTSAAANRSFFEGLAISGETHASSNFVVGLEGEIIQCVPVNEVAYCSSNRNYDTVSIEVCHPDEEGEFTEETMASLIKLTAWLCEEFHLKTDDVIRHYDVTGKECPLYYVRNPEAWDALKEAVAEEMKTPES